MSDNKNERGEPDRSRVNIHESYEVAYWTKKFGCSADALKVAVNKVGVMAKDVEAELKKNPH